MHTAMLFSNYILFETFFFFLKRRKQTGLTLHGSGDVISNLPKDVMNLILMRLPIREAVRTSILSKNWRYRWVCIPDVVFNKASLMKGASEMEHAHVVDQVLLQHVGPILKFSCRCFVPSCSHIDRWIAHLSRNGIEKLILMIAGEGDSYDVPSSIFYCQNLHHLELFNCNLKVPPTFKGFHNLKVLNLAVDISEAATECLVSKCPLLEWLKLKAYRYIWCVKIHAPNLRYLAVEGIFRNLSLGSSPLLTDVSICKYYGPSYLPHRCGGDLEPVNTNSFIQFIEYSHEIEGLALKGHFLQVMIMHFVGFQLSEECLLCKLFSNDPVIAFIKAIILSSGHKVLFTCPFAAFEVPSWISRFPLSQFI